MGQSLWNTKTVFYFTLSLVAMAGIYRLIFSL